MDKESKAYPPRKLTFAKEFLNLQPLRDMMELKTSFQVQCGKVRHGLNGMPLINTRQHWIYEDRDAVIDKLDMIKTKAIRAYSSLSDRHFVIVASLAYQSVELTYYCAK